jgi:hypothetical protein
LLPEVELKQQQQHVLSSSLVASSPVSAVATTPTQQLRLHVGTPGTLGTAGTSPVIRKAVGNAFHHHHPHQYHHHHHHHNPHQQHQPQYGGMLYGTVSGGRPPRGEAGLIAKARQLDAGSSVNTNNNTPTTRQRQMFNATPALALPLPMPLPPPAVAAGTESLVVSITTPARPQQQLLTAGQQPTPGGSTTARALLIAPSPSGFTSVAGEGDDDDDDVGEATATSNTATPAPAERAA